jgi:hypothetical protein
VLHAGTVPVLRNTVPATVEMGRYAVVPAADWYTSEPAAPADKFVLVAMVPVIVPAHVMFGIVMTWVEGL